MTDRELLELAAKAAGMRVDRICGDHVRMRVRGCSNGFWLRPAINLEDAMWLADEAGVDASMDPLQIVRAAAEIGKAMP